MWINAHTPSNPTDTSMDKCDATGSECDALGVKILGLGNAEIDITFYEKVKVEALTDSANEECILYKDQNGGGRLESNDCSKTRYVACYAYCGK